MRQQQESKLAAEWPERGEPVREKEEQPELMSRVVNGRIVGPPYPVADHEKLEALREALAHLDAMTDMLDEIEALSVCATVTNDVKKAHWQSGHGRGLYGCDWEPMAAAMMRRIMELTINLLSGRLCGVKESLQLRQKHLQKRPAAAAAEGRAEA